MIRCLDDWCGPYDRRYLYCPSQRQVSAGNKALRHGLPGPCDANGGLQREVVLLFEFYRHNWIFGGAIKFQAYCLLYTAL